MYNVFQDRSLESLDKSSLTYEEVQSVISSYQDKINLQQVSKNIFNSDFSFLDNLDLIQLSFFLGFFNKDEIHDAHNKLLNISSKFPKISDVRNLGSFESLGELKGVGRKQVVVLSNIFKNLHKSISSLIAFLEKSEEIYVDKIHCSNNLKLFFRLNDINSIEDLIKFLKSIDISLLSEYEKLGLFELLNLSYDKECYKTNSTFISENDSIFQENFIENFKEIIKDQDKIIFDLRYNKKLTLNEVGLKLNLTRERVRQLLNKQFIYFKNLYFIDSLEILIMHLKERVVFNKRPLTEQDLNIKRNINFYSSFFKIIPFKGLVRRFGTTSDRKKRNKILSDFDDFNITIDDLLLIDFGLINDVFHSDSYKFDDDGYLFRKLSIKSSIDLIFNSIKKPVTINELRSIFLSNEIFKTAKKSGVFSDKFASQVARSDFSVLVDSSGQTLDDHIYGTINMLSYKNNNLKMLQDEAFRILKDKGHPLSGPDLYTILSKKFPKIRSKYELAVMLRMSKKLIYTHRARAFIFSIKEHGDVKEVQEHFEDILREFNHVVHVSDVINKLRDRCSFRSEGLSSVKRRNKNIILWGAQYYGLLKNMDTDRELLKKNIEYISKIIDVPKREKYFKLLFPDKKFTEINIGELIDGC